MGSFFPLVTNVNFVKFAFSVIERIIFWRVKSAFWWPRIDQKLALLPRHYLKKKWAPPSLGSRNENFECSLCRLATPNLRGCHKREVFHYIYEKFEKIWNDVTQLCREDNFAYDRNMQIYVCKIWILKKNDSRWLNCEIFLYWDEVYNCRKGFVVMYEWLACEWYS